MLRPADQLHPSPPPPTLRPLLEGTDSQPGTPLKNGRKLRAKIGSGSEGDIEDGCRVVTGDDPSLREAMIRKMLKLLPSVDWQFPPSIRSDAERNARAAEKLVRFAVAAFFDQDLFRAGKQLLAGAEGSFGLVLSSSLDAKSELVVAARGQTMSVAFYPRLSLLCFGSESAATKAGLGMDGDGNGGLGSSFLDMSSHGTEFLDGFRFDLDDVNGEVMLLSWDTNPTPPSLMPRSRTATEVMRFGNGGVLRAKTFIEGRHLTRLPFDKRVLRLGGNPFVEPLPKMGLRDPVGDDISAIPNVIKRIQEDWNEPSESLNRVTTFTMKKLLTKRLLNHEKDQHDGSVDLLITGCEVSLWIGEQFASDLHNAFPKLKVVTLSANKLLAQLGQAFPVPNTGFYFNETSYDFTNTIVLLLSHSGGTFATLNVSNLLKGYTPHLFVVTGEWDTQIARSVRAGRPGRSGKNFTLNSYVFTTFTGLRPAEPVSLTAVAMHALLTQVLFYLMYATRYHYPQYPELGGSTFTIQEVQELEGLNLDGIAILQQLTQPTVLKDGKVSDAPCRRKLLKQGRYWAQHILEGPIAWIMSAIYILGTVVAGVTPLSATVAAIYGVAATDDPEAQQAPCSPILDDAALNETVFTALYAINATLAQLLTEHSFACVVAPQPSVAQSTLVSIADAVIYIFLPWWMTVLLRIVQCRPWLHRVAGRSLLIGDVPWVAQSLEAFVSKTFALSYSIAGLSVSSGNPLDHLVHRHTHRVVRGALLAVGRPDGRLNALTSAENTICLSVNQASSIQNFGVTCESMTVGHNPFKLGLTSNAIFIPTERRPFMSEYVLDKEQEKRGTVQNGLSASALMSILSTADLETFEGLQPMSHGERPDFIKRIEPLWGKGSLYEERFIGAWMATDAQYKDLSPAELMEKQGQMQEIYEGRIASLERFVSFLVMFHAMAKSVQDFWPRVSFGLLGYDMSRSQSIMRIATTASPVSGSDVRIKMIELGEETARMFVANLMKQAFHVRRMKKQHSEIDAAIALMKEGGMVNFSRRDSLCSDDALSRRGSVSAAGEAAQPTGGQRTKSGMNGETQALEQKKALVQAMSQRIQLQEEGEEGQSFNAGDAVTEDAKPATPSVAKVMDLGDSALVLNLGAKKPEAPGNTSSMSASSSQRSPSLGEQQLNEQLNEEAGVADADAAPAAAPAAPPSAEKEVRRTSIHHTASSLAKDLSQLQERTPSA